MTTWHIIPQNMPCVTRHCSKCNKKASFYCSQKFRVNSNGQRSDIWLIYKCAKCDTTWKLTIMRGIKPGDLSELLYEKFANNDAELARKYAFDRQLLKQNDCEIDYSGIAYEVVADGFLGSFSVMVKSEYYFDLKLTTFLSKMLDLSVSGIKKLVESGEISTSLECDIVKYKIRADFELFRDIVTGT